MNYSKITTNLILGIFSGVVLNAMSAPIKISLHSDLHLEEALQQPFDDESIIASGQADVFVLAGDINNGVYSIDYAEAVARKNNKPVIFVAGNHEYYDQDLGAQLAQFREESAQRKNVYFLEQDAVTIQNVRFLGCTLWSDFTLYEKEDPGNSTFYMNSVKNQITDFYAINIKGRKIVAEDMARMQKSCVKWLKEQLAIPHSGPTVVITHFAPVPGCIEDKWKTTPPDFNPMSPYFINDLTGLIDQWQPDYWLYGHTHSNIQLTSGKTRIRSNQKGGSKDDEGVGYRPDFLIELDNKQ